MSRGEQLQAALNDAEFRRTEAENEIDRLIDEMRDTIANKDALNSALPYRLCERVVAAFKMRHEIDAEIARLLDTLQ